MKRVIQFCFLLLFFVGFTATEVHAQWAEFTPVHEKYLNDGNYNAIVQYNSHTGYEATYKLVVRVQNDRVTAIYFSNGGSVHTGFNNESYFFNRGYLTLVHDRNGNVIALKAPVEITYSSNNLYARRYTDYYTVFIQ